MTKHTPQNSIRFSPLHGFIVPIVSTGNSRRKKLLAELLNTILMIVFIPVFAAGVYMIIKIPAVKHESQLLSVIEPFLKRHQALSIVIIYLLMLFVTIVVHELAHANAGRAYGAKIHGYGLCVGLSLGFYTAMELSRMKGRRLRLKYIQIMNAGIEANICLAGVFLMLATVFGEWAWLFASGAEVNLVGAAINALFIRGLDGDRIIRLIVGIDEEFVEDKDESLRLFFNRRFRRRLIRREGIVIGCIKIITCATIMILRAVYPVLLILNVIGIWRVIQWFL